MVNYIIIGSLVVCIIGLVIAWYKSRADASEDKDYYEYALKTEVKLREHARELMDTYMERAATYERLYMVESKLTLDLTGQVSALTEDVRIKEKLNKRLREMVQESDVTIHDLRTMMSSIMKKSDANAKRVDVLESELQQLKDNAAGEAYETSTSELLKILVDAFFKK